MNPPAPRRRSSEMSALLARHGAALPPTLASGGPPTAPGNPAAPRADARRPAPVRPDGTRTAIPGKMTRSEALAIVRRMMSQAAAPPRLAIRVLVPLAAAPSLLERLRKVTEPADSAGRQSLLKRFERVTATKPRPAA